MHTAKRAATEGRPYSCIHLSLLIVLLLARTALAHEGPPFPLFVDQKVDPYVVSLWTDPDVGDALFFVIVNGQPPPDLQVQIGV
jgi:hypothetical protein